MHRPCGGQTASCKAQSSRSLREAGPWEMERSGRVRSGKPCHFNDSVLRFRAGQGEADKRRACKARSGPTARGGSGRGVRRVRSFTLAECDSGEGEGERGVRRSWLSSLRSGYRGRLGAGVGAGDARGAGAELDGAIEPALLEPPRNEPELSE